MRKLSDAELPYVTGGAFVVPGYDPLADINERNRELFLEWQERQRRQEGLQR